MKFYLAGPYSDRARLAWFAEEVSRLSGWTCTSRWLRGCHDGVMPAAAAHDDVCDVHAADVLVLDARRQSTRGGTWVEFGIALERGMPIIVVAADASVSLNVFAYLDHQVEWLPGDPHDVGRYLLDLELLTRPGAEPE